MVLERCIMSHLDGVVEVKPLLFSEIQTPKEHLNLYLMFVCLLVFFFCKTLIEKEELLLLTKLKVLNLS